LNYAFDFDSDSDSDSKEAIDCHLTSKADNAIER
jgi:hypothetical protein